MAAPINTLSTVAHKTIRYRYMEITCGVNKLLTSLAHLDSTWVFRTVLDKNRNGQRDTLKLLTDVANKKISWPRRMEILLSKKMDIRAFDFNAQGKLIVS